MSEDRRNAPGNQPSDPPADELDPDFLNDPDPTVDDAEPGAEGEDQPGEFEEPEDHLDPDPEPQQRRQPGRAARRIESLSERNRALEQRLAAIEGRQQMPDPRAAQEASRAEEQQFRDSLVGLMPEEIALKVADRTERRVQAQMAQIEIRGFDRSDKANFDGIAARDRFAAAKANEIETTLAALRYEGVYRFSRVDILDFMRGKEMRLRSEKVGQQQRRDGARRVARETVRPGSGRGDAGGGGSRRGQDDADLEMLRRGTVGDALNQ